MPLYEATAVRGESSEIAQPEPESDAEEPPQLATILEQVPVSMSASKCWQLMCVLRKIPTPFGVDCASLLRLHLRR